MTRLGLGEKLAKKGEVRKGRFDCLSAGRISMPHATRQNGVNRQDFRIYKINKIISYPVNHAHLVILSKYAVRDKICLVV